MTTFKQQTTNDICGSTCNAKASCPDLWSWYQYTSCTSLSNYNSRTKTYDFLDENPQLRVKRIASKYAKMYLEYNGDKSKKGRFYWMALGAIAAKQVYCGILAMDDVVAKAGSQAAVIGNRVDNATGIKNTPLAIDVLTSLEESSLTIDQIKDIRKKMLLANLFLFLDIYPYHEYYRNLPNSFFTCINKRNAQTYDSDAKSILYKLPYSGKLNYIKHFAYDKSYIKQGFDHVKSFENASKLKIKRKSQYNNLMATADHEQRIILQNCFYAPNGRYDLQLKEIFDKQKVLDRNKKIMWVLSWFSDIQGRQAVMTNSCQLSPLFMIGKKDRVRFYENMEDSEDLYMENERMKFITRIADDFHFVMGKYKSKMEGYLEQLAKENIEHGT